MKQKNEHFSWKKILLITKSSLPGTVPRKACKSQLLVHTKTKSHPLNSWLLHLPRLCEWKSLKNGPGRKPQSKEWCLDPWEQSLLQMPHCWGCFQLSKTTLFPWSEEFLGERDHCTTEGTVQRDSKPHRIILWQSDPLKCSEQQSPAP